MEKLVVVNVTVAAFWKQFPLNVSTLYVWLKCARPSKKGEPNDTFTGVFLREEGQ